MSTKYKFDNPEALYFISTAVVYWMDVFSRDDYGIVLVFKLSVVVIFIGLGNSVYGDHLNRIEKMSSIKDDDAKKAIQKVELFEKLILGTIPIILIFAATLLNGANFVNLDKMWIDWLHLFGAGESTCAIIFVILEDIMAINYNNYSSSQ